MPERWPKSDTQIREEEERADREMAKEEHRRHIWDLGFDEILPPRRCTCGWDEVTGPCEACDGPLGDPFSPSKVIGDAIHKISSAHLEKIGAGKERK